MAGPLMAASLPYTALKAEARKRGFQVALGTHEAQQIILQRHAKDRGARTFPNRDAAVNWLRTQPEVSMRR